MFGPTLKDFHNQINGKKIALVGIGISNTPLIQYLKKHGANVVAFDKNDRDKLSDVIGQFENIGVEFHLGNDYMEHLNGFDIIFRTPGIRPDIEEFRREVEKGALLTSEIEVFLEICPAKIFAVTGSDGKTTTTTLIYEMLKKQGYKVWLGGNIGLPMLHRIDEIKQDDYVVMELSSFQLMNARKSPQTAVITNISPNHLDYHINMDEYTDAKLNIIKYQTENDRLVLNVDNEITCSYINGAIGHCFPFSRKQKLQDGLYVEYEKIYAAKDGMGQLLFSVKDIRLPGLHNVENYLAAIASVWGFVELDNIHDVAKNFTGVEHRLELIRELNGVKYFNDSIASSPSRTIAGLQSFTKPIILMAGGCDKKIPYDSLGDAMIGTVKELVLIGQTASKIEEAYNKAIENRKEAGTIKIHHVKTYHDAVNLIYHIATDGDVVVLSPASTSFDMFKNFEERGKTFKELVNRLPF